MAQLISDDVWNGVDPSAARLPVRTRRRLVAAAVALIVLVIVAVQVTVSGALVPRITVGPGWSGAFEGGAVSDLLVNRYHRQGPATTHVSQEFEIVNDGGYPVKILSVDTDRPGMRVERATLGIEALTPGHPFVLEAGATIRTTIYYDISDCSAVSALPQPIPLVVEGGAGRQHVELTLPPLRPYRTGGWQVSPGDPKAVQWQRFLADHVCDVPYPDGL